MADVVEGQPADLSVIHRPAGRVVALAGFAPMLAQGLAAGLRTAGLVSQLISHPTELPAALSDRPVLAVVSPLAWAPVAFPPAPRSAQSRAPEPRPPGLGSSGLGSSGLGSLGLGSLGLGSAVSGSPPRTPALILMVTDDSPEAYASALQAGAIGVISATGELAEVVQVIRSAIAGWTRLPRQTARALAEQGHHAPPLELSDQEHDWLRQLAAGSTVAALARGAALSERETYRRLTLLYARLGAPSRTDALLQAQRRGLLD